MANFVQVVEWKVTQCIFISLWYSSDNTVMPQFISKTCSVKKLKTSRVHLWRDHARGKCRENTKEDCKHDA